MAEEKKKRTSRTKKAPPKDDAQGGTDPTLEREVAELAAASAVVRYSLAEAKLQFEEVEGLLRNGSAPSQMHRILRMKWPTLTKSRVGLLVTRVKDEWASESAQTRSSDRDAAIRRIHGYRQHAAGEWSAELKRWARQPDHKALAKWEMLLMALQGTREPIAIDVTHVYTQAMLQVTSRLEGDEASEMLAEAREQERLANEARRLLPALSIQDAEFEAASTKA